MTHHVFVAGVALLLSLPLESSSPDDQRRRRERRADASSTHALFMLEAPETAPFPSNVFTVRDATHNTGLRLNLPKPDCTISPSDCDDLDVVNALDGFGLQPQLAIPFDGPIDAATVDSAARSLIPNPQPKIVPARVSSALSGSSASNRLEELRQVMTGPEGVCEVIGDPRSGLPRDQYVGGVS